MGLTRERERLKGFVTYVLGRNPYEFGLVPDEEGFVRKKDLIKAIQEERGWGHVRQSSLEELLAALPDPGIDMDDLRIRARERQHLTRPEVCETMPKLLFIGIRTRAHRHVLGNGIQPYEGERHVLLSSDRDMAERIGRRRDPNPVMVTVNTHEAENLGVLFLRAGETLFLAREIPLKCFTAPPLAAEETERTKSQKKKEDPRKNSFMPGSFIPDFTGSRDKGARSPKEDRQAWKHNKKRIRRQKERFSEDF